MSGIWIRSGVWPAIMILVCLLRSLPAQERIAYQHPDLVVDLGVGLWAWPMPMDWDNDGDLDLVVFCPDVPFNGTYLFENRDPDNKLPVFEPPVRVGPGLRSPQISRYGGEAAILTAGTQWLDFRKNGFTRPREIYPKKNIHPAKRIRANQWKFVDFDGDGKRDLVVGVGDWTDYGWDNAFDDQGRWKNGPLHGYIFWIRNHGTDRNPEYENPRQVTAGGQPIDVFGMPSPCVEDFDGDGDLDIVCGEFLDGFTYYQNEGTRTKPKYRPGIRLMADSGSGNSPTDQPVRLHMELQMITPTSIDWDSDGDIDLICGDEDGRVAFIENRGLARNRTPRFAQPVYFQQKAEDVKFGALVTPFSFDWDNDGDEDLICGNTAGYIGLIENVGRGKNGKPIWEKPVRLKADGRVIRIQAGKNGSIQGPAEAKWGYTTLNVADWDHDGKPDIICNSIWGKVIWFRNRGTKNNPVLEKPRPIEVEWTGTPPKPAWNWWDPQGKELVTQWRTTPCVRDLNRDGLNDLVMLDHEGYLVLFERTRDGNRVVLRPGKKMFFDESGKPIRLNSRSAGGSGRRKFCLVDWDRDGKLDLLANGINIEFWKNVSPNQEGDRWVLKNNGPVSKKRLAGHTTSPTTVDWDQNGIPDLLIGAEDGFLYFLKNPFGPNN